MNLTRFVFLASIILLIQCAGTQQANRIDEETPLEQPSEQWNEEFDPLTLPDFTFDVERKVSKSDDILPIDQILRGTAAVDTEKVGREIPGFRVQLIATRDQEEARSVMREAVISFSEKVYREYDNPYYKIRVGDFKSRYEASKLQEKAVEMGFPEAWVVRTIIWDGPPPSTAAEEAEQAP